MPATADLDAERNISDGAAGALRLQILGALRMWRGAVELDVGPPQQAVLLAVLLARVGRPTSTDDLSAAIWGDAPPPSALNTIHKYVGALRHILEPGLPPRGVGAVIQRRGDSYVCVLDADTLDLLAFRRLVDAARRAHVDRRNEQALDDYLAALALWNGPAGAGLSKASNAASVFATLNAEFLDACAAAADLSILHGQPERALPSLRVAVAMEPFHEPLHARLMLALAAAGRQSDALSVFRAVRRRLADELGLDPGEDLIAAERAVLNASRVSRPIGFEPEHTPSRVPDPNVSGWRGAELIGRRDDFAKVWGVVSEALAGGSGVAMLEGEPGIGKTRLLEAVCGAAERQGALVARGRCTESEGTPALWPWMEIVAALVDDAPSETRESWLSGDLSDLTEPANGAFATQVIPDIGARFRQFERMVAVVRQASERQPILVAIDDVQWADLASLQMLSHLADRMPPQVAMLGAFRDRAPAVGPELVGTLANLSRSSRHRRIRLSALSPADVIELVRGELGTAIDPTVARRLHERTAGNPFFVLELARLMASGSGVEDERRSGIGVPSTLLDVVRHRTVRLDEETTIMLQVAAVIGTEFDIGILAQSVGIDEQTCVDRLDEVQELGLIGPHAGNPRVLRFSHDIMRESVVETTSRRRLPRMHLDVADALERANPGDDAAEPVAFHLWSAGPLADPGRTAEALMRAGRTAAAKCAFESAEHHLQAAAQLAGTAGLRSLELSALAQLIAAVGMSSGYVGSAMELLERAERLARELGNERQAADFLFSRYIAHAQAIQLDTAGRLARRLLERGEASSDPVVTAYGWAAWGIHLWDVGHIGEAREYLARANSTVPADEPEDDGWQLRRDLRLLWPVWFAFTTALHGDDGEARSILDQMDAVVEDEYSITVWATFSVVVAALVGDPAWASYAAERGISVDPDWSYSFLGSYQRLGHCWARAMSGDSPAEMAGLAAEIIAENLDHPPRSGLPTWYCLLAEMWLAAEELDAAERALDSADEYLVTYGQRYAEGLVILLRARLMQARGVVPVDLVRASARRARELSVERGAHLFARRAEDFLANSRSDPDSLA